MRPIQTKTYIFTLIATLVLFIGAFSVSTYFTRKKTDELKADEDKIAINILSLETQYDLLRASSCTTFNRQVLRDALDSLSSKLQFMESQVGPSNPDVFRLKRYYSLLEIKDYVLTQKMSEQCKLNTVFILYFYSNQNCSECQTQEFLLRAIHDQYPQVEIYNFDYDLDLAAVKTLISLHNIPPQPPVLDINNTPYQAFSDLDGFRSVINSLLGTSTKATSTKTQSLKK